MLVRYASPDGKTGSGAPRRMPNHTTRPVTTTNVDENMAESLSSGERSGAAGMAGTRPNGYLQEVLPVEASRTPRAKSCVKLGACAYETWAAPGVVALGAIWTGRSKLGPRTQRASLRHRLSVSRPER